MEANKKLLISCICLAVSRYQGFEGIGKEYTLIIRQTEFDLKEIKLKVMETISEIDMRKK